jgi:Xaa-Pro dipeptidase
MEQQEIFRTAQEYLTEEQIPGWLVYDYRHANPVFWLVISASGHVTRPCYFYLPAQGEPSLLVHHVDAGKFANSGVNVTVYSSRESMLAALRGLLSGVSHVAMEYSPENTLPRVSRVDAGTIELVRSLGPQVVSSADLMQYATHQWTPEQLADHRATADKLGLIVNEAFAYAGKHLAEGINEFQWPSSYEIGSPKKRLSLPTAQSWLLTPTLRTRITNRLPSNTAPSSSVIGC